jgi:hypothetical protein
MNIFLSWKQSYEIIVKSPINPVPQVSSHLCAEKGHQVDGLSGQEVTEDLSCLFGEDSRNKKFESTLHERNEVLEEASMSVGGPDDRLSA